MSRPPAPRRWALLLGCLACLLPGAAAADPACRDAAQPYAVDAQKRGLGPGHHPIGRPLPDAPEFNRPNQCVEGVWFFDQNGDGSPDASEARLFGPQRLVDCDSCHGESTAAKSPQSASVFLRQDAASLCLVCHRL